MNIMLTQNSLSRATVGCARFSLLRSVGVAILVFTAVASVFAQDDRRRRGGDNNGGGDRGNFNPQDMQARMLSALRERFDVANDDEWAVIAERVTKVAELRRSTAGGFAGVMFAGRGGPGGGGDSRGGGDRGGRTSRSGNSTDIAALQAAVQDKLPDAEIKARLDRVREQRKDNEAKLAKAQEELRAVLSVRQEAVAVLAGLLP